METEKRAMPKLQIGEYSPAFPIIQGGMGVMISGPSLAGSVAAAGGIGTIASVGLAATSDDYNGRNLSEVNVSMIKKYIAMAREKAKDGILAINCMCALSDYEKQVRAACESAIDIIISGAGLPLKLPEYAEASAKTALVPIVSSVKAAHIIVERWMKHYSRVPDAFVVETPNSAGGHLGARDAEQAMSPELSLANVVPALVAYLKEKCLHIPVIAAGGIWNGDDVADALDMGASGVQVGTRFAATEEGDAADRFKQAYIDAKENDVVLIKSPCGLPGRAIMSPLVERYLSGTLKNIGCKANCLAQCLCRTKHETFCIADAMVSAYRGDWENGLFFCGSNVWKVKSIMKVKEVLSDLLSCFKMPEGAPYLS